MLLADVKRALGAAVVLEVRGEMLVCLGIIGPKLDRGLDAERWGYWRPSVSLFQHQDLLIGRMELLYQEGGLKLAQLIKRDIESVSPETTVALHLIEMDDPWDFEQVYAALYGFARGYDFDTEANDYLFHITTGTHVWQICSFLLAESRHLPARLVQTSPSRRHDLSAQGTYNIIDLDLSKYDQIFQRFDEERLEGVSFLKAGIETRNEPFNRLIERIERVSIISRDPILLMGPTGAGKTHLASRIYELKRARRQVEGRFVEVNCATLRGDAAMSALFGHVKGAFTGALKDRPGLLRAAHNGVLFLDEIGELGLDEQAMLLRAIESRRFTPMGADEELSSDFQLIAGTNRDLREDVARGKFREDLLARINLWSFELPGLKDRLEDLEPNLDFELERFSSRTGRRVTMNKEARQEYLRFATSPLAKWSGNFRDLNASMTRMATLADGGRINNSTVEEELVRLRRDWIQGVTITKGERLLVELMGQEGFDELDRFDKVQLADVVEVCQRARSLSEAGRELFAASRARKKSSNDADRLRKYLSRFGLEFQQIQDLAT